MRIAAIHIRGAAGGADVAHAAPGLGFGDAPPKRSGRELSLMDAGELERIRGAGGLCSQRFSADIMTEGLCYSALRVGDRLRLGGAVVEISEAGKRCFDECPIRARGERCPLPRSCAFARVLSGGDIKAEDELKMLRGGDGDE